jgi:gliding motility-associated-like protein
MQILTKLIFSFLLILISWSAGAQISVDFTANLVSGCSPVQVVFSNGSSSGPGYTYSWNLGNGTVSTAANPQTIYVGEGAYTVSLTVTYDGVSETLVKEDFIVVHNQPVVNFSLLSDTIGCAPYTVTFENNTVDPEGSDLTYTWSLGDGNLSNEAAPAHTYMPAGNFDVTLLAENAFGCSSSYTEPQLVHVVKPQAVFGVHPSNSCTGELEAFFTNNSVARTGYATFWDFGDGTTSDERSPAHFYDDEGAFTVQLTITDDIGCTSTVTRPELIKVVETRADFTMSANVVCPRQNVRFTNNSQNATSYLWRFGDGTTSRATSPQKSYPQAGAYEVWLIADNGTCKDSTMRTLTVEHVEANFTVDESFICQLPATINYENLSVNGASYEWKFGSGGTATTASPVVTLPEEYPLQNRQATFTDTLVVTSTHGCTSTYILQNAIKVVLPTVAMSPTSNSASMSGCVPMQLSFTNQSTYNTTDDAIDSWSWRVNNGAWQTGNSIDVSVTESGRVPVQLRLVTEKGCVHSKVETINAGATVDVDFERLGNYERCASETVMFDITSPDPALRTREVWDYGDASDAAFPVPFHDYEKTGTMDVTLTVYNNGCPSSLTKSNLLNILGPYAKIAVNTNCNDPFQYGFSAEVMDATSYQWDFGDGSALVTSTLTPQHRYAASGNYVVTFTAHNASTGCSYAVTRDVYVRNLSSAFSVTDGTPCLDNTLTLDGSASVDYSPFSYNNHTVQFVWLFEEEGLVKSSMEALSHTFVHPGVNHVSLVVQDANGCRDTVTQQIHIYRPEPDFEANYEVGCMPVTFGFTDLSTSDSPIQLYEWDFGDGNTSTEQNPNHEYSSFGTFNVSLKLTDEVGCVHTITKEEAVQAIAPDAGFAADKTRLCIGDEVRLYDASNSQIVEYLWEVSDGRSYSNAEPVVLFAETGHYSVSLYIKDVHGCEMTGEVTDFFHVQEPPVANFVADITDANCYPLVVQFSDLSETDYPGSWSWHFGENDNLSEVQNPFFIYNRPGFHDVQLISRTSYGCADTIVIQDYIHVGGPFAQIEAPDVVCAFDDVNFKAVELQNVYDIRWDFGDGYSAEGPETMHQYGATGHVNPVMFLRSDADNTCNKAIVDTVHVWDVLADFTFVDDSDKGCVPLDVMISNTSLNATDWQWDLGDGTSSQAAVPVLTYEEPGMYDIELIASYAPLGCADTMVVKNIEVFPLPTVDVHADTLICYGDAIELWANGGVSYLWSPPETLFNPQSAATMAAPDLHTTYNVQVTDANGCVAFGNVLVSVQQPPVVFPRDTVLIIGEEVQLNVSDAEIDTYAWSPADHISCTDCANPVFKAMESMSYQVTVTDVNACFTLSYPFNLTVQKIYSVDVPQAFTPNGDGVNDVVFVKGWGIRELVVFRIFNRFGQLVYDSANLHEGWDGTFKGRAQPMETYSYMVQVRTEEGGLLQKTGTIKLLR